MTARENDSIYEGETRTKAVTVTDENDDPVSLDSAQYQIYSKAGETIVEKTDGDGIQFTAPDSGELAINIDPGDTQGKPGNHRQMLQVTDQSANVNVVLAGKFDIEPTPF